MRFLTLHPRIERKGHPIDSQISQRQQHEAQVSKPLTAAKDLVSAIEERGLKIGKAMFQELTRMKKSILDKDDSSSGAPLPWDKENAYTRDTIELYYEEIISNFLQGECASKWVKVNERRTLHSVLKEDKFVIPGILVFFAVSKRSKSFYNKFKSRN
ncbi:unnamed protein product [Lactuca saligna]|uniref:Uncharacterized protein n=1 Tax=Lactuca saligna TaxID=75948 RepID=A0AA36ERU0_LACSI|nr:unnamed protein product [Lactuca saligna]